MTRESRHRDHMRGRRHTPPQGQGPPCCLRNLQESSAHPLSSSLPNLLRLWRYATLMVRITPQQNFRVAVAQRFFFISAHFIRRHGPVSWTRVPVLPVPVSVHRKRFRLFWFQLPQVLVPVRFLHHPESVR